MKHFRISFRDKDGREWCMVTARDVSSLEAALALAFHILRTKQSDCTYPGCSCLQEPAQIGVEELRE